MADPAVDPIVVRAFVGVAGTVLALFGARVYRPALLLAGFGGGAVATVLLSREVARFVPQASDPGVVVVAALVGGVALAGLVSVVHRVGLVLVGATAGATVAGGVATFAGAEAWWAPLAGAVAGAIALSWTWEAMLVFVTPAVGAALLAWAVGMPGHPVVLAAVFALGVAVQLVSRRKAEA